jgi:hypothetical protein
MKHQATHSDLMAAYREGLFSDQDLLAETRGHLLFRALAKKSVRTALRVADAFGGETLFIPHRLGVQVRLTDGVPEADAQVLIALLPNSVLCVPRLQSLRQRASFEAARRRQRHRELEAAGVTTLKGECVWAGK